MTDGGPSLATRPALAAWIRQHARARALTRRTLLGGIGGLSSLALIGCSSGGSGSSATPATTGTGTTGTATTGTATTGTTPTTTTTTTPGSCVLIPQETVGPYPLFNDIASAAAFQREDIKEGKTGVPLNLMLDIVNVNRGCEPILTAMVYVWHCDKDGFYSGYNQNGADLRGQTFLRGVQTTDTNGRVTFRTIYPGWYPGRATHIHVRVYLGLDLQATSQHAFPDAVTSAVYATSLYAAKGENPTKANGDGIFSDGVQYQMPTLTANAATGGYDAQLTVGIAA
jgi:protocatechuate 3,4-dioxygenase beta subunit